MGGRDHSCEVCGRGGFNDPDGVCECDPTEANLPQRLETEACIAAQAGDSHSAVLLREAAAALRSTPEAGSARVDTFAPPDDAPDKDVARMRAYAKWLTRDADEAAQRDGAALTRILNRLREPASDPAHAPLLALAEELDARANREAQIASDLAKNCGYSSRDAASWRTRSEATRNAAALARDYAERVNEPASTEGEK